MVIQIHPGCDQHLHDLIVTIDSRIHEGRVSILPEEREREREREKERGVSMDDTYTEESWSEIVEYFRGPW